MAWPSGTKASTANVDNPSDLVADARADIKQNIDNVNTIIDEFNISSPSDGQILKYNSTAGNWENVSDSLSFYGNGLGGGNTLNLSAGGGSGSSGFHDFNNLSSNIRYTSEDRWTHPDTGNYTAVVHILGNLNSGNGTLESYLYNVDTTTKIDHSYGKGGSEADTFFTGDTTATHKIMAFEYSVTDTSHVYGLGWDYDPTGVSNDTLSVDVLRLDVHKR